MTFYDKIPFFMTFYSIIALFSSINDIPLWGYLYGHWHITLYWKRDPYSRRRSPEMTWCAIL